MTRIFEYARAFMRAGAGACLVAVAVGACASPPYIHDEAAYNRAHSDFGKPRTDRTEVTVCYARNATTADEVAALADAECRRFGKTAVPRSQDFVTCPLATPAAANFDCRDPALVQRPESGERDFYTRLIESLPTF
jgi:hypothetical protein